MDHSPGAWGSGTVFFTSLTNLENIPIRFNRKYKVKHLTDGDISSDFTFNTNYGSGRYFDTVNKTNAKSR